MTYTGVRDVEGENKPWSFVSQTQMFHMDNPDCACECDTHTASLRCAQAAQMICAHHPGPQNAALTTLAMAPWRATINVRFGWAWVCVCVRIRRITGGTRWRFHPDGNTQGQLL